MDKFIIEGYFTLADFLYQIQWYMDAIAVYTQIIERFPEDERTQWALYRVAASYRNAGKGNAEVESLKRFAGAGGDESAPRHLRTHTSFAECVSFFSGFELRAVDDTQGLRRGIFVKR